MCSRAFQVVTFLSLFLFSVSLFHEENFLHELREKEFNCLVVNAYHEARSEGPLGIALVTQTVINRALKKRKSVCEIVYDKFQYSWTLSKNLKIKRGELLFVEYHLLEFLNNEIRIPERFAGVTHYHTTSVNPKWSSKLLKLGRYQKHIFYKEL